MDKSIVQKRGNDMIVVILWGKPSPLNVWNRLFQYVNLVEPIIEEKGNNS